MHSEINLSRNFGHQKLPKYLNKVEYLKKLTLNGTYIDKLILTVISSILKLNIKIFNYEIEYDIERPYIVLGKIGDKFYPSKDDFSNIQTSKNKFKQLKSEFTIKMNKLKENFERLHKILSK